MARPKRPDDLRQVGFRLPAQLMARVDAYAEKTAADMPGHSVSRSTAIRVLLERALTAEGFPPAPREPEGAKAKSKAKR